MAAARFASRLMSGAGMAFSGYNVFAGGSKMVEGFKNNDSQKIAGGAMQAYGGATGPVMSAGPFVARAVHGGGVFGARMAIPQERQELRNRVSATAQAAADILG
jgi:hypothetical protein